MDNFYKNLQKDQEFRRQSKSQKKPKTGAEHRFFLLFGGTAVCVGFLIMLFSGVFGDGSLVRAPFVFWVVNGGLVLILCGVATTFAKDKDGKERLVEDIEREELKQL